MKSTEPKKTLEQFDKKELIRLIIESAKLNKDNMEWLEIDFKKASPDRENLIDIMIYYVEQGTEITLDCGDMYEDFYTKLENVYIDAIKLLNEWGDTKRIEKFRPRMETLVDKTEDVGWGYHDVLWDWYDELGASQKEE